MFPRLSSLRISCFMQGIESFQLIKLRREVFDLKSVSGEVYGGFKLLDLTFEKLRHALGLDYGYQTLHLLRRN